MQSGLTLPIASAAGAGHTPPMSEARDLGTQPVDALMQQWGLTNHDMVDASPEQLTHKQVQRARKGRMLTLAMMQKLTRTLNIAVWYRLTKEEREQYFEYLHRHLFNYAKGYDAGFEDPNQALMAAVTGRDGKIISREA
jgi:hypothetical protein